MNRNNNTVVPIGDTRYIGTNRTSFSMVLLLGKIADEWSIQGVAKETRILHASPTDIAISNSIVTADAEAVHSEMKQTAKKVETYF